MTFGYIVEYSECKSFLDDFGARKIAFVSKNKLISMLKDIGHFAIYKATFVYDIPSSIQILD